MSSTNIVLYCSSRHERNVLRLANRNKKVAVVKVALYPYLIIAVKAITILISSPTHSWAYFVDCSRKRPPPVSDHSFLHQGWSLSRELTVVASLSRYCSITVMLYYNTN